MCGKCAVRIGIYKVPKPFCPKHVHYHFHVPRRLQIITKTGNNLGRINTFADTGIPVRLLSYHLGIYFRCGGTSPSTVDGARKYNWTAPTVEFAPSTYRPNNKRSFTRHTRHVPLTMMLKSNILRTCLNPHHLYLSARTPHLGHVRTFSTAKMPKKEFLCLLPDKPNVSEQRKIAGP